MFVVVEPNVAVTPAGRIGAVKVTGIPKFNGLTMVMVDFVAADPLTTVILLGDNERVKLGTGTVTVMLVVAIKDPDVPVIVIV